MLTGPQLAGRVAGMMRTGPDDATEPPRWRHASSGHTVISPTYQIRAWARWAVRLICKMSRTATLMRPSFDQSG